MAFSRNFKGITLTDGAILVEGINNTGDDVYEENVRELRVMLVARPEMVEFVQAEAELPLTSGRWDVVIPDVPAPFDTPGRAVVAIGFVTFYDPESGEEQQVLWGGDTFIK